MTEETQAAAAVESALCDHCGQPKSDHKLADDCQLAGDPDQQAATNPHGLLRGLVRAYQPYHQNIVLREGPHKVGLASIVGACNGSLNHMLKVAHNLRHMRGPCEILMKQLELLFQEVCKLHQWSMKHDILPLLAEMQRAQALALPGNADGEERRIVTLQ